MDHASGQSFWSHLDELRAVLVRIVVVTLVFGIVAFLFKDELFAIVLAPKLPNFVTYKFLFGVEHFFRETTNNDFAVQLINTGLAEQFIIHMKTALCAGLLCASPYILYQLFRFVSPALYSSERKYAVRIVSSGYIMFLVGVLVSYFLIFPLTFRFLGTYQVSGDVQNLISLQSYMNTLIMMSFAMGIIFEMPILAWLFAKIGFLSSEFLRKYHKHAVVIILIVAAIITPTSDIFTLLMVSLPMWLLFRISIWLVKIVERRRK